jgi:hypothetical protein
MTVEKVEKHGKSGGRRMEIASKGKLCPSPIPHRDNFDNE